MNRPTSHSLLRSRVRLPNGSRPRNRRGLSAVEMVIAALVLVLLTAIATPLLLSARESARRSQCGDNLRRLGIALHSYHDTHATFPAAAVWSTSELQSLDLHLSRRVDLYTQSNWAQALLPFTDENDLANQFNPELPIAHPDHERPRTTRLDVMNCSSDSFNRVDNPHHLQIREGMSVDFARGNYAINGGTNCFKTGPGTTAFLTGDAAHLEAGESARTYRLWGNGIAGFNVSFSLQEFENGASTLIALEEIRAGVHPIDPRGVWSLGQIASSVTWGHGVNGDDYGPNNLHPRSDDILNCGQLHNVFGTEALHEERMPCVSYLDVNQNATSRSQHDGGVNVLFLDGATRFLSDDIDPGLWHVLHSRETRQSVFNVDVDVMLAESLSPPLPGATKVDPAMNLAAPHQQDQGPITFMENSIGMRFALLPAGEFIMGLPDAGNEHDLPPEVPAHRVEISNRFYIGIHEVTRSNFRGCTQFELSVQESDEDVSPEFPMTDVTWEQATEFCKSLSNLPAEQAARRQYRLPTEAEWEYACRAGSTTRHQWRSTRRDGDATGEAAGILPPLPVTAVGSYAPNAFGLYDMRGNVWEWCADWFDRDYYTRSPRFDPTGPNCGYFRVVRGGDWVFVGEGCKINYAPLQPWKSSPVVGFRIVCEVTGDDTAVAELQE
jgi:prepilin-type processing-associated H-X9-DG protein